MKFKIQKNHFLFLPVLVGMGVLALSTRYGPGIGGDATIYIKSAENLLQGHGLGLVGPRGEFRLIPYFPPFYSLVLAFFGLFGADLVRAAYWLNLFLFAAIIWLSGDTLYRATRSLFASLLVEILVLASPVLIPVYSWAMSEPLSIFLGFFGVSLVMQGFEKLSSRRYFYFSAMMCGLSFLTRYAAVVFVAVSMAAVFIFTVTSLRKRLVKSLQYFCIAFIPMLVWLVIDWFNTSTVASRSVMGHTGLLIRLQDMVTELSDVLLFWLVPDSWISSPFYPAIFNKVLLTGFVLVLILWFVFALRQLKTLTSEQTASSVVLLVMLGLFCLGYILLTMAVFLTTYPPITIGSRMFAPMHVAVLWLFGMLVGVTINQYGLSRYFVKVPAFILLLFCGWYMMRSSLIVKQNYLDGQGYLSPLWQNSETIQAVKKLSPDTLLVTNEETAILFLTERPSYPLAEIYREEPSEAGARYGDGTLEGDQAQQVFRNEGAALVLFDSIGNQLSGLYGEQTTERVGDMTHGLDMIFQGADGAIYFYPVH